MGAQSRACVVTCQDYRLHMRPNWTNYVGDLMRGLRMDCDLITRAGGVQDLLRGRPEMRKSLLRDLQVSVKMNRVRLFCLLNHEDCRGYGHFSFATREDEIRQHHEDLDAAAALLVRGFPGVTVRRFFAECYPNDRQMFRVIELAHPVEAEKAPQTVEA